jgi:hypothetical protein
VCVGQGTDVKWVSRRRAVGDEKAEVAEGSRDMRVEAGECPERTYFVP